VVDSVLLYQIVFRSKKAGLLAVLLCLCFSTQSVKFADAQEVSESVAEVVVESGENVETPEPEPEMIVEDTVESEDITAPQDIEEEVEIDETTDLETAEVDNADVISTPTSGDTTEEKSVISTTTDSSAPPVVTNSETDNATSTSTSTSAVNDEQEVSTSTDKNSSSQENTDEDADSSSDSNNTSQDESDEERTDEDEPPTTSNENLVFTVESDTHFSFNKNECTRIEDGTFYCQKQSTENELEDSLIAAPDSDGDLEIFLVRKGERYQITHNEVDDASPYYDELSNTIVWHRLLNDRYQIMSYDIESAQETQLTQTSVNDMEPARHGEYTVWQRWVENNWEVILFDGKTETQITDSARHDIAPHIRGPLVIWNSQSNDGSQELRTYDINNRTQTTISDGEGVSVSNPRMVVMYEAMYENGDIVTKGFDLVSGKIVPLQALPKQLPEELPDSEPTKEVRALIQNKPEPKESTIATSTPSGGAGTSTASSTATTTNSAVLDTPAEPTLDLRSLSTPELIEYLTEKEISSSTVPDLIIEPQIDTESATHSTTTQIDVPDLIVEETKT